ncbi:MAG: 4Fe-4S binding protein [Pseudomonadota bacterium]
MNRTQRLRLAWRTGFFALFLLAAPLDLFRYDLTRGHFILFGQPWTLGIDAAGALPVGLNILLRGLLPLLIVLGFGIWVAWRYGRLYCGWLCPHFSVVELINALMRRACGKPSLWERDPLPERQSDGTHIAPRAVWWLAVGAVALGCALLWAITLLTYLLPPAEVWGNLAHGTPTRNQALFIGVATLLLLLEFTLARHLFCRFGCAVGLFQSLIWMGNPRALVVGFDTQRAALCAGCDASCEHACPMRLQPRRIKRRMFTCTQCQQCIQACDRVNRPLGQPGVLRMVTGDDALHTAASAHRRPVATPAGKPH